MTYNVFSGTLNITHSHSPLTLDCGHLHCLHVKVDTNGEALFDDADRKDDS